MRERLSSKGTAFGKIILLGEHAVVMGHPALAAALERGVQVVAEKRESGGIVIEGVMPGSGLKVLVSEPRVLEAASRLARLAGISQAHVTVDAQLPLGGGLGSSGAFAVALFRALSGLAGRTPDHLETWRAALESEQIFHGSASGVDPAVSAMGGVLLFRRGEPPEIEKLQPGKPLKIVVALSGKARSTAAGVNSLLARCELEPERYVPLIERLGMLAEKGAEDLRLGELEALGEKMNEAHGILQQCELSSAELEQIVAIARAEGALGAKLTGAGRGGAAIALVDEPERVLKAVRAAGFDAFSVELR